MKPNLQADVGQGWSQIPDLVAVNKSEGAETGSLLVEGPLAEGRWHLNTHNKFDQGMI